MPSQYHLERFEHKTFWTGKELIPMNWWYDFVLSHQISSSHAAIFIYFTILSNTADFIVKMNGEKTD